jgi:hypothetical protein
MSRKRGQAKKERKIIITRQTKMELITQQNVNYSLIGSEAIAYFNWCKALKIILIT